jgi:hypothetical protein
MPAPERGGREPGLCYECFWAHQDPAFREQLVQFYGQFASTDPLIAAQVRYLLARVRGDEEGVCEAFRSEAELRRSERDPARRMFLDEVLAFTAETCGAKAKRYFRRAATSARAAGDAVKAAMYAGLAKGTFWPKFGIADVGRGIEVPKDAGAYVIGESAIRVGAGCKVGVQTERTVRDWISYQMAFDFSGQAPDPSAILSYHEGARLRELMDVPGVSVVPLSGTVVARRGEHWYAPDEDGVFRFEVLEDKVQYPTTRTQGDLAYLVDTHGVSVLVPGALREGAQLVIGCGDYPGKVQAAYHLARRGVDVYFPCDRFVGDLIGYDAPGTLVGSAPIRVRDGQAVIGDRPVTFSTDETVVVEDTDRPGLLQYYDAPARYFRRLNALVRLRLEWVRVDGSGQSERVVRKAKKAGAKAIAVRVWTEEDYRPVRDWLAESAEHRAVLFHSAAYPAGYRLFQEFPRQTTFGDPRPRFLPRDPLPRARGARR